MGKVSGDEGWDGRGAVTILAWPLNDMVELFSDIRKHNPSEIVSIVVDSCNNTIIHLGVSWSCLYRPDFHRAFFSQYKHATCS